MVVSALVLLLDADASAAVLARLGGDERFTVGEPCGARLPVVTRADGLGASEALASELGAVPGVLAVDVVLVDFDPESDVDARPALSRAQSRQSHGTT